MKFLVCFLVTMALAVAALVIVVNAVNAAPGVAMAALGLLAAAGGTTLGYFADRLPDKRS